MKVEKKNNKRPAKPYDVPANVRRRPNSKNSSDNGSDEEFVVSDFDCSIISRRARSSRLLLKEYRKPFVMPTVEELIVQRQLEAMQKLESERKIQEYKKQLDDKYAIYNSVVEKDVEDCFENSMKDSVESMKKVKVLHDNILNQMPNTLKRYGFNLLCPNVL